MKFLEMLEQERLNDPMFKAFGIWYHKGEVGVWYNPLYPGNDPFRPIPERASPELVNDTGVALGQAVPGAPGEKARVEVGEYLVETMGSSADPEFFEEVINELDLKRMDPATEERDKEMFKFSIS